MALNSLFCKKCGHTWIARCENPKSCPHCNSRNWHKPKTDKGCWGGFCMKTSPESDNKGIPEITQEDLDHISPLHQIIAKELIAAGKIHLIEKVSAGG